MGFDSGRLREILVRLREDNPYIRASAVVTEDGLPVVSALPEDVDEDLVAAMGAAILSVSEKIAAEVKGGRMRRVLIEAEESGILVVPLDGELLLVTLFDPKAKLGVILYSVKKALGQLTMELKAREEQQVGRMERPEELKL